jgi:hypothetical protein
MEDCRMKPEIFADGFSAVTFRNGMIRMDLGSLPIGNQGESQSNDMDAHHRLVLTPQGFLQDLARRLAEAGVIRRTEAEPPAVSADVQGNSVADKASDKL